MRSHCHQYAPPQPDTLSYAYKASYSSDITVPGNPVNTQKVLKVWKMFQTANVEGMKPYYADTVTYDDASGMRFHGPIDKLLTLPNRISPVSTSMRFDITATAERSCLTTKTKIGSISASVERRYPKNGHPLTRC